MKILSYEVVGDMIRIVTDFEDMPEFVYFKDKFKDVDELSTEINRKISVLQRKKTKKDNKLSGLISSINNNMEKNS